MNKWTRRAFIGAGTLPAAASCSASPASRSRRAGSRVAPDGRDGTPQLTTWITITPDNIVTILIPHCEMGPGHADGARDDGGRGDGGRLDAGARRRKRRRRRLRERLHRARVRWPARADSDRSERGVDYGTYKLAEWFGFCR